LYQPIDRQRRFFIEPRITLHRSIEDIYEGDDAIARFQVLRGARLGRHRPRLRQQG
jgi:hypothetical protein